VKFASIKIVHILSSVFHCPPLQVVIFAYVFSVFNVQHYASTVFAVAVCLSVCLSVSLFTTTWCSAKTAKHRITETMLYNRLEYNRRCSAAAGPRLWNMLPTHLRLCDSLQQFKQLLKTHLFGVWDRGAL